MFPLISLVTPLFNIERLARDLQHLDRADHPVHRVRPAAGDLYAVAFFREIPWELEKAAKVDGATPFQAFVRVIAPLAAPGMVTTAILVFLFCWNEFPAGHLADLDDRRADGAGRAGVLHGSSQFTVPTGSISAAAVVITIPIIIFVLFFQRRIVAGLTSGAVKG
jgi:multiple sugar transport system permease protein